MKFDVHSVIEAGRTVLSWFADSYLVWGAVGSAIAQMYARELGLKQRVQQWTVGVVVMHLAVRAWLAVWPGVWPPVVHIVAFLLGFLAFAALGVWQAAAVETGARAIRDAGVVWRHLMQGWAEKVGAARAAARGDTNPTEGNGE